MRACRRARPSCRPGARPSACGRPARVRCSRSTRVRRRSPTSKASEQLRRACVQQASGQPVVVVSPVTEQRGPSAVVLLTGPKALDGVERLQRRCHRVALRSWSATPGASAPATRTRATARPGSRRVFPRLHGSFIGGAVDRGSASSSDERPQAGGAQLWMSRAVFSSVRHRSRCPAAAPRIRNARQVGQHAMGMRDQRPDAGAAAPRRGRPSPRPSPARVPLRSAAARSASGAH